MNIALTIIHIFGIVTMGFGCLMATCFATSKLAGDGATEAFYQSTLITFVTGVFMVLCTLNTAKTLSRQAGFLLVATTWSITPIFCALPLLLHFPQLSFADGYFEAVSALTTSGGTVLSGLDSLPLSINLWRHELSWVAGMGVIVFAVAILPILGIGGMQLYKAGMPGSVKESELPPRIAQTAKALWMVYAGMTAVCIIALKLAGMSWFDAVCHAFSAMSLGGFSTHDSSIGFFNSVPIEVVLTVFQLLAGINFASHFIALSKRDWRGYSQDSEARSFLLLVLCSCLLLAVMLHHAGIYPDFLTALRYASFNVVSMATDSGFVNQDFSYWPIFVPIWMLLLSCLSASSGSTGGGIRMIRTIILIKQARMEMFKFIHPYAVKSIKVGDSTIHSEVVASVTGFIFLYFISIVFLVLALLVSGLDFMTAFSAIIACFNNAGPGLNLVGPGHTYAVLTDYQTNVCSFAMLLGRVQIYSILILFMPDFWRK